MPPQSLRTTTYGGVRFQIGRVDRDGLARSSPLPRQLEAEDNTMWIASGRRWRITSRRIGLPGRSRGNSCSDGRRCSARRFCAGS
jgi:hypothetical protein